MYALRKGNGEVTSDSDDILKIAEEFDGKLCAFDPDSETIFAVTDVGQVPPVTTDEVATALNSI